MTIKKGYDLYYIKNRFIWFIMVQLSNSVYLINSKYAVASELTKKENHLLIPLDSIILLQN